MEPRSQNDLVEKMLNEISESGQKVTDKVSLPGIASLFTKAQSSKKEKTQRVHLPALKKVSTLQKTDFASLLTNLINDYSGIVGLSWDRENTFVEVRFVEGWVQKRPETDIPFEKLEAIFTLILKVRTDVQGFNWNLGESFVEVTYLAR